MTKGFTLKLSSALGRINTTRLIPVEDGRDEHVLSQTHYSHVSMKKSHTALSKALLSRSSKPGKAERLPQTRGG